MALKDVTLNIPRLLMMKVPPVISSMLNAPVALFSLKFSI